MSSLRILYKVQFIHCVCVCVVLGALCIMYTALALAAVYALACLLFAQTNEFLARLRVINVLSLGAHQVKSARLT